jgi:hypothetical protein
MKSWLRLTLPHDGYVAAFLFVYVLFEAILPLISRLAWGVTVDFFVGNLLLHLGAVVYAAHRVFSFHPAFSSAYHHWLATTPWTSRRPLPVGPIHLVTQDFLILAFLAGLAWMRHPLVSPAGLILEFLMVYELSLAVSFAFLKMPWFAYAIAFGLGLVTWLAPGLWPALAVAVAIYVVSYIGLRRALDNFENWDLGWMDEQPVLSLSQEKNLDRLRRKILGWPYDCIRPQEVAPSIAYRDGTMLSLLVGWWAFVMLSYVPSDHRFEVGCVLTGFACQFAVLTRLAAYCWGYAPPINVWGRIFTLRWIIPGYDQVFLAPLATIGVTVGAIWAQRHLNIPAGIAAPLTFATIFLFTLNGAPTLKRWRLTGNHRLSPAILMSSKKSEVTEV